jgi:hypothetical protein
MILGWRISLSICIYLLTLYTSATSMIFYFYKILIATFSPVKVCVAALTLPNVPLPKVLPKSWFSCTYDVVPNGSGTIRIEC